MKSVPPVRLSVVTVCWNDLANVKRTVESLKRQSTRHDWEHVLIDGASSDGTAEWYGSATCNFAHRFVSEPDNGIFDAMNKALDVIKGDYVVYLNAGDRYADDGAVARILSRLKADPIWGYGRARVVNAEGRNVRPQVGRIPYSRMQHLLGRATICHQAVVMRADFLRSLGGFDLCMGAAADYHLLVKAANYVTPITWAEVDVEYLAGGVSDTGIYRSLWDRHRARVDALALKKSVAFLDSTWTALQVVRIGTRKTFKPLLGPIYLKIRK